MLRVLTYHRVADPAATPGLDPALVSATPDAFRRQMRHLSRRYRVVSLEEVLEAFRGGAALPARAVLLTFDDAYRDFGDVTWPILRRLHLSATLFVPTAYPGRPERSFWWDRLHRALSNGAPAGGHTGAPHAPGRELRAGNGDAATLKTRLKSLPHDDAMAIMERVIAAVPPDAAPPDAAPPDRPPVLDWAELRELARDGVSLGAHTRTHPALTGVPDARIREELRGSLEDIRAHVGDVSAVISYPYGYHDGRVVQIAREEDFQLGFTNLAGLNRVGETDPLRLCRTNITRRTTPSLFQLRMRPWFAVVDRWRKREERRRSTGRGRNA